MADRKHGGYPVGKRTQQPHHKDGWGGDRSRADEPDTEYHTDMPKRGQPPQYGEHDRKAK